MEAKETIDRVERLLALLLIQQMKGSTQLEKATQLSVAGFSNTEKRPPRSSSMKLWAAA